MVSKFKNQREQRLARCVFQLFGRFESSLSRDEIGRLEFGTIWTRWSPKMTKFRPEFKVDFLHQIDTPAPTLAGADGLGFLLIIFDAERPRKKQ